MPTFHADFKSPQPGVKLNELERGRVVQALERTKGNQTQAAKLLGVNRDQVLCRVENFGLPPAGGLVEHIPGHCRHGAGWRRGRRELHGRC